MNFISNNHSTDRGIAELTLNCVVGITLPSGDCFDMFVESVDPSGFVSIRGPRVTFDEQFSVPGKDPMIRHELRDVELVMIASMEVY